MRVSLHPKDIDVKKKSGCIIKLIIINSYSASASILTKRNIGG